MIQNRQKWQTLALEKLEPDDVCSFFLKNVLFIKAMMWNDITAEMCQIWSDNLNLI